MGHDGWGTDRVGNPPKPVTDQRVIAGIDKRQRQDDRAIRMDASVIPPIPVGSVGTDVETSTGSPWTPTITLPTTGRYVCSGWTSIDWGTPPAGRYLLIAGGTGIGNILTIEQAGGHEEVTVPWSFIYSPLDGDADGDIQSAFYAIDGVGTPDSITTSLRLLRTA